MKNLPLACNMTAMSPAERQRYGELKIRLQSGVKQVKELLNGYAFGYEASPALLMAAGEFVAFESRCCPFFHIVLDVHPNGGPLWLRVTGPKEAKPFIKDALAY